MFRAHTALLSLGTLHFFINKQHLQKLVSDEGFQTCNMAESVKREDAAKKALKVAFGCDAKANPLFASTPYMSFSADHLASGTRQSR